MSVIVRAASPEDSAALAVLAGQLGYPCTTDQMRNRILALQKAEGHAVFVACAEARVVAWLDADIVRHLAYDAYGEIAGFVVDAEYRSAGIGRQLIVHAENWFRSQGMTRAVVRSRVTRQDAHRFYLREGYSQIKTSAVFEKSL